MRCHSCGSHLSFGALTVFSDAGPVDRQRLCAIVRDAIDARPAVDAPQKERVAFFRRLALAYLNLQAYEVAGKCLRVVLDKQPWDAALSHLADEVDAHVASSRRAPSQWVDSQEDDGGKDDAGTVKVVVRAPEPNTVPNQDAPHRTVAPSRVASEVDSNVRPFPAPDRANRTPRVLIVDDSPTVRKLVSVTLSRNGYEVLTASDGMEALSRTHNERPDLILLDVSMPHIDGLKVCQVIKSIDATRSIPVIFLSGSDGFLDKVRGRTAGAADFLVKPFDPATLLQVLSRYLNRDASAES